MVLMKSYGGVFFSVLTVPKLESTIDTMEDLVMAAKSGQYDIILHRQSLFTKFLKDTECCDDYYIIGRAIKRYFNGYSIKFDQDKYLDRKALYSCSYKKSLSFSDLKSDR